MSQQPQQEQEQPQTLAERIEQLRKDEEFQASLKRTMERNQETLELLAK